MNYKPSEMMIGDGSVVDLAMDLDPSKIGIHVIASALSKQCRFAGATRRFYSVAEHSVLVAERLTSYDARLLGLFHDAAEAYIGDIIRPLRSQISGLEAVEDRVWKAIAERFGLPATPPREVAAIREVDDSICSAEIDALILREDPEYPWVFECWSPEQAYLEFCSFYARLEAYR